MASNTSTSDPVIPGENWFCYWKTSAALWESKISLIPQQHLIIIPINWGYHESSNGTWDFGQEDSERDLPRLVKILAQHNRSFIWLMPISPCPIMTNGGVPVGSSICFGQNLSGLNLACLGPSGDLNKMYSFFEPKVFKAFCSFTSHFAQMLVELPSSHGVWGVDFCYLDKGEQNSFFEDSSKAFQQGFSRFLKKNYHQGADLIKAEQEQVLKQDYTQTMLDLFRTAAEDGLAPFWKGSKKVIMLGGSPTELFNRSLLGGVSLVKYFKDLFQVQAEKKWFSTALLSPSEKNDLFRKLVDEHFGNEFIETEFELLSPRRSLGTEFQSYALIDIYTSGHHDAFAQTGLLSFLDKNYRWLHQMVEELMFNSDAIDLNSNRIKIFHSWDMNKTKFAQVIKLFMLGHKVILDRSGLSQDLLRKLQVFYIENNFNVQAVNYVTHLELIQLGDGILITYDGEKLRQNSDCAKFWSRVFEFLQIEHPAVYSDEDIFYLWRVRSPEGHELNFKDIRKVNFYNPSSYKRNLQVKTNKKFALTRILDRYHSQVQNHPHGVDIELLPGGQIALEFGSFGGMV